VGGLGKKREVFARMLCSSFSGLVSDRVRGEGGVNCGGYVRVR